MASTEAPSATNSGASSSTKLLDWVASELTIWTTAATDSITSAPWASSDHREVARRRLTDASDSDSGSRTTPSTATNAATSAAAVTTTADTTACGVTTNGVEPSQVRAMVRSTRTASPMPTGTSAAVPTAGSATANLTTLRAEKPRSLASATSWRRTSAAEAIST